MDVKFCGAAGHVTGSAHLVTLDNGYKILLDCGLYQGIAEEMKTFNESWEFDPRQVDCVVLSHAHIDHSGRLPKLVKDGFRGKIIATHATRDLCAIMLLDSAKIQERDAEYANKQEGRTEERIEPLYVTSDVMKTMDMFVSIGYNRRYHISDNAEVEFRDAGHILGSASVHLRLKNKKGEWIRFGFTGDIGRPERPILRDPIPMDQCDYLICESTYGDRLHKPNIDQKNELLAIVEETCVKNRGKLIIPAFSVGRTQEIVHLLDQLESGGEMPPIPVFVDSPLAVNATQIFQSHPECFDENILDYMLFDPNPFGFNRLRYIRRVEESKRLNNFNGPCVIISASGMATAGRIRHHIFNHISNPKTTILIVGYCAPYTLGGQLREGASTVKMFGEVVKVKARVKTMYSFSAHGDQQEMIDFMDNQDRQQLKKLFLVHGEPRPQRVFQKQLTKAGFLDIHIPTLGESVEIV